MASTISSVKTIKAPSQTNEILSGLKTKVSSIASEVSNEASAVMDTETTSSFQKNLLITLLVIVVLAFLGFNIFRYLGNVTQIFADIFGPVVSILGINLGNLTKDTVNLSAAGTKGLVDVTAGTVNTGINLVETGLNKNLERNHIDNKVVETDGVISKDLLNIEPTPDEADSITQTHQNPGKSGFCYVGQDRNVRHCVKIGDHETCMSGEIFPSQALCINPNLRE